MKNIKTQILEKIKEIKYFAFEKSQSSNPAKFIEHARHFLESGCCEEAGQAARHLMRYCFSLPGNSKFAIPVAGLLEKAIDIVEIPDQHFIHIANTYLLGLYLYHICNPIKEKINSELHVDNRKTIDYKRKSLDITYQGEGETGDFYYRWRLYSMIRVIGYAVLTYNKSNKLNDLISKLSSEMKLEVKCPEDLLKFKNIDILEALENEVKTINLKKYINDSGFDEHFLIGALLSYQIAANEYWKHSNNLIEKKSNSGVVVWSDYHFKNIVLKTIASVAFHNLSSHKEAYDNSVLPGSISNKYVNFSTRLLRLTETLCQWDKPDKNGKLVNFKKEPELLINFESGQTLVVYGNLIKIKEQLPIMEVAEEFIFVSFEFDLPAQSNPKSLRRKAAGDQVQEKNEVFEEVIPIPSHYFQSNDNITFFDDDLKVIHNLSSLPPDSKEVYASGPIAIFENTKYKTILVISRDYHATELCVDIDQICTIVNRKPIKPKPNKITKTPHKYESYYTGSSWSIFCDYQKRQVIFYQSDYHAKVLNLPFSEAKKIIDRFKKFI